MQVAEAAVIAIPHPKWDERPLLIVVPVEGSQLTASDMLSFLKVPDLSLRYFVPEQRHLSSKRAVSAGHLNTSWQ